MLKLLLAFSLLLLSLAVSAQSRFALVIGNEAYPRKQDGINDLGRLDNPRNDANDIANLLKQHGFTLVDHRGRDRPLLDASKPQMDAAVDKLMANLRKYPNSEAWFYFSGHGIYLQDLVRPDESANYLLPVGVNFVAEDPAKIKAHAVNAHNIKARIETSNASAKLMIIDACREKLVLKESKGFLGGGEFRAMNPINGMMVVHATLHSYKAWGDGDRRNSRFTEKLLNAFQHNANRLLPSVIGKATQAVSEENQQYAVKYHQYPMTEGVFFKDVCLGVCGATELQVIRNNQELVPPVQQMQDTSASPQPRAAAPLLGIDKLWWALLGVAVFIALLAGMMISKRQPKLGAAKLQLSPAAAGGASADLEVSRSQHSAPEDARAKRAQRQAEAQLREQQAAAKLGAAKLQLSPAAAGGASAGLEVSRSQHPAPEMVDIPAGSFRMGDIQGNGDSDEQPVHVMEVAAFALGRYPVTRGEFKAFIQATGYKGSKVSFEWGCKGLAQPHFKQNDQHPVTCVTWLDALAYTEWLSEQTGQAYRLPTEAEWEYAARAGSNGAYGQGQGESITQNNLNRYAWFRDNSDKKTHPVGSKRANAYGLHDMHGNVWEWTCSAWSSTYNGEEQQCKKHAARRSFRGGSWDSGASDLRSAGRSYYTPDIRCLNIGLRLAREK